MITKQDLESAIAECHGERNPNASTCIKLAAFYTIRDAMFPQTAPIEQPQPQASYASSGDDVVSLDSDTEFARVVNGLSVTEVMRVMDELMSVLEAVNPRLYAGVMRKFDS